MFHAWQDFPLFVLNLEFSTEILPILDNLPHKNQFMSSVFFAEYEISPMGAKDLPISCQRMLTWMMFEGL